jgi:hypothetical protein
MHDEHGELVSSLQRAQVREQRRDFTWGVLVDAVQAHQRIEHQEARLELHDGVFEGLAVGGVQQDPARSGDGEAAQARGTGDDRSTGSPSSTPTGDFELRRARAWQRARPARRYSTIREKIDRKAMLSARSFCAL